VPLALAATLAVEVAMHIELVVLAPHNLLAPPEIMVAVMEIAQLDVKVGAAEVMQERVEQPQVQLEKEEMEVREY
jgi:hypothetical protein